MHRQRLIGSWMRLIGNQRRRHKLGALKGEALLHQEAKISEATVDRLQEEARLTLRKQRLLWEAPYSSLPILFGRLGKRRCNKQWRNSSRKDTETQASRNGCAMLNRHEHSRGLPKAAPTPRTRHLCLSLVVGHSLPGAAAAAVQPLNQDPGLRFHEDHRPPYLQDPKAEIALFHDGNSKRHRRLWCRMQDQG